MNLFCRMCHQSIEVNVTEDEMRDWTSGTLIQNAMPNLTPAERELFISGYCGKCWDKLFKDES